MYTLRDSLRGQTALKNFGVTLTTIKQDPQTAARMDGKYHIVRANRAAVIHAVAVDRMDLDRASCSARSRVQA
ncbi:MAG: hypothetical protein V7609_144 [Verrucomicrobiota bacterium]